MIKGKYSKHFIHPIPSELNLLRNYVCKYVMNFHLYHTEKNGKNALTFLVAGQSCEQKEYIIQYWGFRLTLKVGYTQHRVGNWIFWIVKERFSIKMELEESRWGLISWRLLF